MALDIALLEPEIPQNTGNIIRTCVAVGARLHLIGTLGFALSDRHLKRAGLDYWYQLSELRLWDKLDDFLLEMSGKAIYYTTTKSPASYADMSYPESAVFLFGKETKGLPESLLLAHPERMIRIPMTAESRSLNLSNSVAIVAYEFMRQQGFPGLAGEGTLQGLN